jgi:hypothetical protein
MEPTYCTQLSDRDCETDNCCLDGKLKSCPICSSINNDDRSYNLTLHFIGLLTVKYLDKDSPISELLNVFITCCKNYLGKKNESMENIER